MTIHDRIDDFLRQKRLAVVGVSRSGKDFSRMLFAELRKRGYDVVPVNPRATEVDGLLCFAHIQDVTPPVDAALLMTQPAVTERVVQDCVAAGVKRVWMYRGVTHGAVSQGAIDFCEAHQIDVVPGYCPFMFLPEAGLVHRAHGYWKKLTGSYPN